MLRLLFSFLMFVPLALLAQVKQDAFFKKFPGNYYQLVFKKSGDAVNTQKWQYAEDFVNEFAIVKDAKGFILVNNEGQPVSAKRYDSIRHYSNGLAAFKKNERWGFIDGSGNEIIAATYMIVSDVFEDFAIAYKNEWLKIDKTGKKIETVTEYDASRFLNSVTHTLSPSQSMMATNSFTQVNSINNIGGSCPVNLDFELANFTNWYCYIGRVTTLSGVNTITYLPANPAINSPTAGRHTIITSGTDPYGGFPLNPPNGSGHAIKLGNNLVNDSAERVRYVIHVPAPADEASITFQYAVVLENPTGATSHTPNEKPRMMAQLRDSASGAVVSCADFLYVAASTIPGFFDSPVNVNVKCKSWTPVFVNLSPYAGRTMYLEFTTADCTQGAHFGYAYVDVGPCNQTAEISWKCNAPHETVLTGPPGFTSYKWFDSNFSTVLGTTRIVNLNPGPPIGTSFFVEVIPPNGTSCKDTLKVTVTATYPPAVAGPDIVNCSSQTIALGTNGLPLLNYQWTPASGLSNAQIANPQCNATHNSIYTLEVSDTNNCISRDTVMITVNAKPTALFSVNQLTQCAAGNSFTFSNTSSIDSGTITHQWIFGDGNTSNVLSPTHSYLNPGTYPVKLVVTSNNNCVDSMVQNITVYAKPSVGFSINNASQCFSANGFVFSNGSTISAGSMQYAWDFGDGQVSSSTSPSHSYTSIGNYTIWLVATSDNGCKDSTTASVTIYPSPLAAFTIAQPQQCLNGNSYSFVNNSSVTPQTPLSYTWDFGDGNNSTQNNPVYSYAADGTRTVKLVVLGVGGCKDSVTQQVVIHPKPNVVFSVNADTQCLAGNNFVFNSNSSINTGSINYAWELGDGSYPTVTSFNHTYAAAGNYTVWLNVVSDKGCKDSMSLPVTVNADPLVNINTFNPQLCRGKTVTLSAGGATTYSWSPAQGLSCSSCASPTASPAISVSYIVTGLSPQGCPGYDTAVINVIQPFKLVASHDTICIGEKSFLHASGANTYVWSPATALNSTTIPNPVSSTTSNISYQVVGYDAFNCFTDTARVNVVVGQYPTVNLGPDLTLSTGTLQPLNSTITNGPIGTWLWSPPANLDCSNCPLPTATIRSNILYTVRVTNIYGCSAVDTIGIKAFCENSQVYIPNAFTPDNDGVNDVFMVQAKGVLRVKYLRIFNRWGELVFEKLNFMPNDPSKGWDGKVRGIACGPDVFVYVAEVFCDNGPSYFYKGNVSLLK